MSSSERRGPAGEMRRRLSRKESLVPFEKDADTFRVVVLGPPAVGKTALTVRFLTKRFIGEYCPTLEQEYRCSVELDGTQTTLEILDTAGEMTENTRDFYLQWADCLLVLYSISDHTSYAMAEALLESMPRRLRGKPAPVGAVVGNKCDLCHKRQVERQQGQSLADKHGWTFYEVSASDGRMLCDVTNIFTDLVQLAQRRKKMERKSSLPSTFKFKSALQRVILGNKFVERRETFDDS